MLARVRNVAIREYHNLRDVKGNLPWISELLET
jgi:hypothetical protein